MLPPFFDINNFTECMEKRNTFCIADFQLYPTSEISGSWQKILDRNQNVFMWDISKIHRGLCLSSNEKKEQQIEALVNTNLSSYNLTSTAKIINCMQHKADYSYSDYFVLLTICFLLTMVAVSTLLDCYYQEMPHSLKDVIQIFSLKNNIRKITNTNTKEDSRLKSMQTYRVLIMNYIIYTHAFINFLSSFFLNIEALEAFMQLSIIKFITHIAYVIVNIFFLISSFLLSNQILHSIKQKGTFTTKDAFKLILKRYLRIIPSLVAVIYIHQSSFFQKLVGPVGLRFWSLSNNACNRKWLHTALMINNHFYLKDMCFPPSWYLSNDFQAYVIVVLIYYVISKFNLNKWKFMTGCLLASTTIYGYVIYSNNLGIAMKLIPGALNPINYIESDMYTFLYTGLQSTLSVSLLGMLYGAIYHETKNRKIFDKTFLNNCIFYLLVWGLPSIAIILKLCHFTRLTRAFLGSILKLIFVSGPGIHILGIAHGFGGLLKNNFENKYMTALSNISYSVYISNFLVWIVAEFQNVNKFEMSLLVYYSVIHWLWSIFLGLILALTVELPGINIVNLLFSRSFKTPDIDIKEQKKKIL